MRVAFIARSTLFQVHGGITVQVQETARALRTLGVDAQVILTDQPIRYDDFDLLHFFDITRPANILHHTRRAGKPYVLSPVMIDYSEYDRQHRKGVSGFVFRKCSPGTNEYIKAVSKWMLGRDKLPAKDYLWKGHQGAIREVLQHVSMLLPNSQQEYEQLEKVYRTGKKHRVIPNGIDTDLFNRKTGIEKDPQLVICAARIEGIKNQLNLIRALRDTGLRLLLIGDAAPNQQSYYQHCRAIAGDHTEFIGRITQPELMNYYREATVHVLPSWFETCGLSSLEAAAMGCNIVVSDRGFTRDYFGDDALYCDPGSVQSIREAVMKAANSPANEKLINRIPAQYTWEEAARHTLSAYEAVLSSSTSIQTQN